MIILMMIIIILIIIIIIIISIIIIIIIIIIMLLVVQIPAIILYTSGLFDSKSIVKEVVWRKNKQGGRLLIQGRDYYYHYYHYYHYHYYYHVPCRAKTLFYIWTPIVRSVIESRSQANNVHHHIIC